MNRNYLKSSAYLLLLAGSLSVISCKKNANDRAEGLDAAENNAFAEAQFNDVTTLVDQASVTGSVTFGAAGTASPGGDLGVIGSSCVTVTVDTVSNPHSITIDFGTSNCLCLDNRLRRGKIIATYTGKYRDAGTVVNISFDNYFVNENKISGTKKVTNQGNNQAGNLVYKVEVNGQVDKANNGGTFSWISTRYREWKAGILTPLNILDDVYGITGEAHGTSVSGNSYSLTINQELVRKMNCKWFESGSVTLTQERLPDVTLNYGATGCDANAVITLLNVDYPIVLQ